ncbi:MAG: hypothetical protein GY801_34205 [bacterium]|nr:hypothetical protein [bacterium]
MNYMIGMLGSPFLFLLFPVLYIILFLGWVVIIPTKRKMFFLGAVVVMLLFPSLPPLISTPEKSSSLEALQSLPYLTWRSAEQTIRQSGVTHYEPAKAFEGLNLYNPRNLATAYLIDMHGTVVHTWSKKIDDDDSWHHIKMDKDGDLFAIVKDKMLIRLDWDSQVKWVKNLRAHHDIAFAENQDIYVLVRQDEMVRFHGIPTPILNDYIMILSQDGTLKQKVSLFEIFKHERPFQGKFIQTYARIMAPRNLFKMMTDRMFKHPFVFQHGMPSDIFHANAIEIIERNIPGVCDKGDVLISMSKPDIVAIVNLKQKAVRWQWGPGYLSKQHHPTLLANNDILIFDNGVETQQYSRIVQIRPSSHEIVWEYAAEPPDAFFSHSRGASQRLPNGNTLITESDSGHVFEITSDGDIVWEFYNPEIRNGEERSTIYRMMRIVERETQSKLNNLMEHQ